MRGRPKGSPNKNGTATGWIDKSGYRYMHDALHPHANSAGKVTEHVVVASRVLGYPLPIGAHVHHVNEVRSDNRNCNLVICENSAYHDLLHARKRMADAGADPNTQSACRKCGIIALKEMFPVRRERWNGRDRFCFPCHRANQAARRRRIGIQVGTVRKQNNTDLFAPPNVIHHKDAE